MVLQIVPLTLEEEAEAEAGDSMTRVWRNVYGQVCEEETAEEALERLWRALSPEYRDERLAGFRRIAQESDRKKDDALREQLTMLHNAGLIPW
jgi:ribosomal protein L17